MLINKICDSVDSDSRNVSELSDKELYARALDLQSILEGELSEEDRTKYEKEDYDLVSEIVRRRRAKDGKVSDSLDDMIAELEAIPWWATDEVTEQVKKIVAQNGTKTIKKDGKEILTFAESQSGAPMYSYKQHAWTPFDKVQDDGVTKMSDIGSNRPGKFGDSFDIESAVKIEVPKDSIDASLVKLVKSGIRVALQGDTLYAESSREDAEKALEGLPYKILDSADLSKFKVKLRDVEEVRKRFKDAGTPLYWSGRFLYADAPETKVDEILGDIDHTFFLTLSGGDGMMWIKIPDDKQRHDAMVKLIVAGLQTHAAGDRLLVREDRDKVKEVLEGFDYQIMDSAQADQMSYSWEEFADKVGSAEDAASYSDHVVVSGDKAYRVQITEEVNDALPALAVAALTPIAAKVGEKVAEKLGDSIWGTKDEACQFATRESANKTLSACKLQDSATVVKSPKGFFKIVDHSGRSYKGPKIMDSKTYTKDELLAKRPSWVADSAIWEKAVNMITDSGANSASAKSSVILYKRLGGKRVADSKMVKAPIVDDLFQKIDVGDTLRVVNGDNPGRFGEVLSINEDGSYLLRDLKTKEEFSEPSTLYGVFVNVVDSEGEPKIEDAMDSTSLRKALSVILETPDYKTRQEALTSKVATFLNLYGMDVEVSTEDGTIWLNDDNTKVKVDDNKVWIMRPDEETESYGLLDEIETWFTRIKELSAPVTEA